MVDVEITKKYEEVEIDEAFAEIDAESQEREDENVVEVVEEDILENDTVRAYLKSIGNYELLTYAQEIELGRKIQAGIRAEGVENPDDETKRILREGKLAEQTLTEHNLKLVVSVARRFGKRACAGMSFLDMIQEGNLGLMKAVRKYDPEYGTKFSTIAVWWIRQSIARGLADSGLQIRIPVHIQERMSLVMRTREEMIINGGQEPTAEQIAVAINRSGKSISVDQVTDVFNTVYFRSLVSLDMPISDEGDFLLSDTIPAKDEPTAEEEAFELEKVAFVEELLSSLPEKSANVLRMRFGIGGHEPMTLKEIGDKYSLTRERIRQIEKTAMERLVRTYGKVAGEYV